MSFEEKIFCNKIRICRIVLTTLLRNISFETKTTKRIFFTDIIVAILKEKFNTTIDEAGKQRISEFVKTELLVDAVNRRLTNANQGNFFIFLLLNFILLFFEFCSPLVKDFEFCSPCERKTKKTPKEQELSKRFSKVKQ